MASNNIDDNISSDSSGINPDNSSSSSRSNHKPTLNLKVGEVAEQRDVGRKIARIDPEAAERFRISTGDALE
ncbi:MAG: hypothetical protein WB443_14195, partial [Nitrososphaeraceae archaeon]